MGGKQPDGVSNYPATPGDLRLYDEARAILERQPLPRLVSHSDPDTRLFVACLDGTGQDMSRPGELRTNVGALHADLLAHAAGGGQVTSRYVEGPGTQSFPPARVFDAMTGHTADERVERMYRHLGEQVSEWKRLNPAADVAIAAVGYSRGAIEAVMLTRLVDRYGIVDPSDLRFTRDANGDLKVESSRPPLVSAGVTPQALVLFDPVSTGIDRDFDLRPPPSVITGLSFWARDERRALFPHRGVIDLGLSEDGRFAGILVPGAHSDVGGGNVLDGLEIRTDNLARTFINGLSDSALLPVREMPTDPAMTVIHRSHQMLFGTFEIGSTPAGGKRSRREDFCVVIDPCRDAEPRDELLAARFGLTDRPMHVVRPPAASRLDQATHPGYSMYRSARDRIAQLDHQHGVTDMTGGDRAGAALAASAREAGTDRISHVVLGHDRQRLFAVDTDDLHSVHRRIAYVEVATARAQRIEVSSQRFEAATAQPAHRAEVAAQNVDVEQAREVRTRSLVH